MPISLVNFSSQERADLSDLQALSQDQPTQLVADIMGAFASRATAQQGIYILQGFGVTAGSGSSSSNPQQNQLLVAPGTAIAAWRMDAGTPRFGLILDASDAEGAAQSVDCTTAPSSNYTVWLRMVFNDASQVDRTFWAAGDPAGYEFAKLASARKTMGWEVQYLATGSNPGSEWVSLATFTWTAPSTQGGVGSLTNVQDTRPLYFEGTATSSSPYSAGWGSGSNDRSADRSTYGVGDLRTALGALRTCLEDIKGPGLARWWDPGVAGLNVGFTPNTPTQSRLALGDAGFYLQGRSAATAGHAYLAVAVDGSGKRTGWDFASDRTRYILGDNSLVTYGGYGTVGFGQAAEADIMNNPGRALLEVVTSVANQGNLRLGARLMSGMTPVGLDVAAYIVAPDQSGNMARVVFGKGGVQGSEALLFWLGKGADNGFVINDIVGSNNFFSFAPSTKTLGFAAGPMIFNDVVNNVQAFNYSTSNRVMTFSAGLVAGNLSAPTVAATSNFSGPSATITNITGGSVSVTGTANAGQINVNNTPFCYVNRIQLPVFDAGGNASGGGTPMPGAQPGAMYYDANSARQRVYIYVPGAASSGDDGLPAGWKRVQFG